MLSFLNNSQKKYTDNKELKLENHEIKELKLGTVKIQGEENIEKVNELKRYGTVKIQNGEIIIKNRKDRKTINGLAKILNMGENVIDNVERSFFQKSILDSANIGGSHHSFFENGFFSGYAFYYKKEIKDVMFVVNGQHFEYNTFAALAWGTKGIGGALGMTQSPNASYKVIVKLKDGNEVNIWEHSVKTI
ncbi:MAG: hypothetical protein LBR15_03565 [Methanobrevibacter sp.]|jgi:hypothetical protein|nr:hypothetical protein [Candidatus Methanovirga australis]